MSQNYTKDIYLPTNISTFKTLQTSKHNLYNSLSIIIQFFKYIDIFPYLGYYFRYRNNNQYFSEFISDTSSVCKRQITRRQASLIPLLLKFNRLQPKWGSLFILFWYESLSLNVTCQTGYGEK